MAAWPGFVGAMYGIAVDIGSTTVAGHLCDLTSGEVLSSAGVMNPQIRFGEDLMSRVSYVMMNKGGEKELTFAIRNALNLLVVELAEKANVSADKILEIVMVGNPIMHHILLGIDQTHLVPRHLFLQPTRQPVAKPSNSTSNFLTQGSMLAHASPAT